MTTYLLTLKIPISPNPEEDEDRTYTFCSRGCRVEYQRDGAFYGFQFDGDKADDDTYEFDEKCFTCWTPIQGRGGAIDDALTVVAR